MKKETFVHGVTILEETFNRTLNRAIAWEILRDIDDLRFMGAVRMMVKDLRTLFPNDNVVAIVREYVDEFIRKSFQNRMVKEKETKKIDWEPCPPPAEWEELKAKIGRVCK